MVVSAVNVGVMKNEIMSARMPIASGPTIKSLIFCAMMSRRSRMLIDPSSSPDWGSCEGKLGSLMLFYLPCYCRTWMAAAARPS